MKTRKFWSAVPCCLAALCCLAPLAAAAEVADPVGTWKWERTRGDRTMSSVLKLDVKDGKLVGTYAGRGDAVQIEEGKIEGNELSFKITRSRNDRTFTLTFQGKITEDTVDGTGTFQFGDQTRDFEWQAKRSVEPSDVVGNWKFEFTTSDGQTFKPSLKLSHKGDSFEGVYSVEQFGEFEAQQIKIKDNQLTFQVSGENDGNQWKVTYKGQPRGAKIQGTIEYDVGGQTGSLEFTGKRETPARDDDDDDDDDGDDDNDDDDDDDDDDE